MVEAAGIAPPSEWQLWTILQIIGPPTHPSFVKGNCAASLKVWPGPGPLTQVGDVFRQYAFCGGGADSGLQCRLLLIYANDTASARFTAYNQTAAAQGDPGLVPNGDGIFQADAVVVTRH